MNQPLTWKEALKLTAMGLGNTLRRWRLYCKNLPFYIRHPQLIRLSFKLMSYYTRFYSPTKSAYEQDKAQRPNEELVYDDTPYAVLAQALKKLDIHNDDIFIYRPYRTYLAHHIWKGIDNGIINPP